MKSKNDVTYPSTWTCDHIKSFLKSHGEVQSVIKAELLDRCHLLIHFIKNDLDNLISLSKPELRSMCAEFQFPVSADISKDNMIKSVSDAMMNN